MKEYLEREDSIGEHAVEYRALGLNPVPLVRTQRGIPNSGKQAAIRWISLQGIAASIEEIRRWYVEHPEWNLGLVTGAVGGIVVMDADTKDAVQYVLSNFPHTAMQSVTPKGRHFFYGHPGVVIRNGVRLRSMPLDIRGDGGYVVAPPSVGWTGHRYQWVEEPSVEMLKNLPKFDPSWIEEERKFPSSTIEPSPADPVKRAALYISRIEGAVSGSGGHAVTMRVAGILIQKFGLSIDQALPLFLMWNMTCSPPWTERELLHKLQDAVRNLGSQRESIIKTIGG